MSQGGPPRFPGSADAREDLPREISPRPGTIYILVFTKYYVDSWNPDLPDYWFGDWSSDINCAEHYKMIKPWHDFINHAFRVLLRLDGVETASDLTADAMDRWALALMRADPYRLTLYEIGGLFFDVGKWLIAWDVFRSNPAETWWERLPDDCTHDTLADLNSRLRRGEGRGPREFLTLWGRQPVPTHAPGPSPGDPASEDDCPVCLSGQGKSILVQARGADGVLRWRRVPPLSREAYDAVEILVRAWPRRVAGDEFPRRGAGSGARQTLGRLAATDPLWAVIDRARKARRGYGLLAPATTNDHSFSAPTRALPAGTDGSLGMNEGRPARE